MVLAMGAIGSVVPGPTATAQLLDLHAATSVETLRQSTSWGGGIAYGVMLKPADIAYVGLSLGVDYLREQHLGIGRLATGLDLTLALPGASSEFVPYIGGGISTTWSSGEGERWTGARLGLDALLGAKLRLGGGDRLGWKIEERYGYVRGFEHAFATRLGLIVGL